MLDFFKSFTNTDGSTSYDGQQNAGRTESNLGYQQPSNQQSHESADAYNTRVNSFWDNNSNNN